MTSSTTVHASGVAAPALAEAVLDTVGLACAVVAQDTGRIVWCSRALETLTRAARADVVGAPAAGTLLDDVGAAFVASCGVAGDGTAGPVTFDGRLLTHDGTLPVAWTVSQLFEEPCGGTHLLLVAGDRRVGPMTPVVLSHVAATMTGVPVLATDTTGRVTYCNTGMEGVLGRPAQELLGEVLPLDVVDAAELQDRAADAGLPVGHELFMTDARRFERRGDRSVHLGALDRRSSGADGLAKPRRHRGAWDDQRCDWTVVQPDGTRVVASVLVRRMSDSAGGHVGYLASASDVTTERRTHALLLSALDKEREASRRLSELDAVRNDFVSTAGHELRTPVTSIRGYAEMLADGGADLSPRGALYLEAILRNADRLCALADDLLVLSSPDAGNPALELVPLDLRQVVDAGADALRTSGLPAAVELKVDVPASPVDVVGDERALQRALGHLLANAVESTESGSVDCALREDGDHAVLEVADTGIGIPEEEQAALFTRFSRTSAAHSRAVPGSGLGLSVVRSLVHAHGGEVTLASRSGQGTRVTVRLPLVVRSEGGQTRSCRPRSPA